MEIVNSFGKNIIVNGQAIGYISRNGLYVNGRKFADVTEEGEILFGDMKKAYVNEYGDIICKDVEIGYVDMQNNFVFTKNPLMK